MKGIKKIITSTVLILVLLLLCVSCNNAVEETTGVGYINLSDVVSEGASRSLIEDDTAEYDVDKLFWTYKAEKTGPTPIRDKTGQTEDGEEVVVSFLGASDTDFSQHQGLSNKIIGPLAVGTWKITVYGYLNNTEPDNKGRAAKKQSENVLIYTGETDGNQSIVACEKENARDRSKNKIEIQLKSPETLDGYLRFSANPAFTLKVPENMAFYSGSGATGDEAGEIVVKMIDVTAGNTKATGAVEVAVSRTTLAEKTTYKPGDPNPITLSAFEFTDAVRDKIVELQDGTETYKYYSLATVPQVHKFEVIVEYKDSWTRRENEYASGTPRYNEDSFYDKGYAPVGDIITFPLKSVGGLKVVLSGDVDDIKANGGEVEMVKFAVADFAIVYWNGNEEDRTKVPLYFGTLQDAVNKWVEKGGMSDPEGMRITVLRNISDGGELNCVMADTDGNPDTPADTPITVPVPIHLNGYFIDNLTIDGGSNAEGSVIFCIPDTTSGQENVYSRLSRITIKPYKAGDPATAVEPQVKNISYKVGSTADGDAMVVTDIFLDGGDCVVEARSNHTIYLSGTARNISVGKTGTEYIPTVKLGTKTDCEVEELAVLGGKIEFGSWTKVARLALDANLATGSSLKGTTSAYIGNLKDGIRYGNIAKPGQASASAMNGAQKAVFTQMTLNANNGSGKKRPPLYGIEGMNIELPDFDTDSETSTWTKAEGEVSCTFMLWNTKDDVTGTSYDNCSTLVTPKATETEKTNLYAIWAQPLGGKVFFINATASDWTDVKSYHFFGAQKKEMTQWQGSSDIAKALSGAVYALNTDLSVNNKVYVAYTDTDPMTSEGNVALYGESSQYNYFKDYDKVSELQNNDVGDGKTNTETVLGVLPSADDNSVFWGIKALRNSTDDNRGQKDWFIGCKAEYEKLTESTLARPQRITTLTVETGKVHTYTGDIYLNTWSLLPYGVDSRAFLVPLRSF